MNNSVKLLGITMLCLIFMASCDTVTEQQYSSGEEQDGLTQLVTIFHEMTERITTEGIDRDALMRAYHERDLETAERLWGYSQSELDEINLRLQKAHSQLKLAGDIQVLFDDDDVQEEGCHWLQYTIALGFCVKSGPIGYWFCAYLAYCNYCYGPTVDALC